MKFSLFYELTTEDPNDPGAESRRFQEALEQCQLADEVGFQGVWAVEHHFLGGYSSMSCPELFLAAVSQRTTRLRLGHAIMHLPFNINHPVRCAEHIATLDILSDGRVEFGGGRATSHLEFEGFGVDPELTQRQWEEALQMLPLMWTQEEFQGWESDLITIPPRRIAPKPVQKPHPPMWVASTQPYSVQWAGEHGLGVLGFGISDAHCDDYVQMHKDALKTAKPPTGVINDRFAVLRMGLCAPTDDEAIELQEYNYRLFYKQISELFRPWLENEPPATYEHIIENFRAQAKTETSYSMREIVEQGQACIGSPETCANVLNTLGDAGIDEVLLFMQGATTPHEKILQSIRLFATEVAPRLKQPEAAPAGD
ncbi:MAG: LLM class flavin-dependent oxidoreductase [Dehalococcoidia bacterium]